MCGIIGIFGTKDQEARRSQALKMASSIRHRGPDWSGIYTDEFCLLVHERLSIVDVEHGAQPLHDTVTRRVLIANGEIFYQKLMASLLSAFMIQPPKNISLPATILASFHCMLDGTRPEHFTLQVK